MAAEQRIKVFRLSDRALVQQLRKLAEAVSIEPVSITASGFISMKGTNLKEGNPELDLIVERDAYLVETMAFALPGLNCGYYRGGYAGAQDPNNLSPYFDEFRLTPSSDRPAESLAKVSAVAELKSLFPPVNAEAIKGFSAASEEWRALNESTLVRLQLLNEELVRQGLSYRKAVDADVAAKAEDLEGKFKEKVEQLDAGHSKRSGVLDAREADLDKRNKALDDRGNTHARREIRNRMLEDVKARIQQFGVSQSTEDKRRPVALGMFCLAALLLLSVVWTGYEAAAYQESFRVGALKSSSAELSLTFPASQRWWLWLRLVLLSIGLCATVLYFVRWTNKWAQQHADAEFNLQQFYIDVNRANWVVETCLEWRKETASAIPNELLIGITRGLFASQPQTEQVLHPADELASALMGSASKLSLDVAGNKVEIDKPAKIPKVLPTTQATGSHG